jgi:hypothetical protein
VTEVICADPLGYSSALTRGKLHKLLAHDVTRARVRVQGDNGRIRWFPSSCFDMVQNDYTIWIEAESWEAGEWRPEDSNSDVVVMRSDGSHWVATFVSYQNVETLTQKNKQTREALSGAYFWCSNMLLVDEVSRGRIEEVVHELMRVDEFEAVFARVTDTD